MKDLVKLLSEDLTKTLFYLVKGLVKTLLTLFNLVKDLVKGLDKL